MSDTDDEAWARNIIEELHRGKIVADEKRDQLAESVETLARGFTRIGAARWRARRKTPGNTDMRAPDLVLGSRVETVQDILRYETNVNILSAADQMRGFAVLLRAEASLMGAVSVARGVFEACLWAGAIIDPTVDSDTRVQRALTRRLARLSAGIRLQHILATSGETGIDSSSADDVQDDHHGSGRDPQNDIKDILDLARGRGWNVVKGGRAPSIGSRLSIDWLAENLEHAIGIEGYAWSSGSSMSHGEHAADTASWVEMSNELGTAPAWLIQLWSTGVWAGPRLFLASLEQYSGRTELAAEYAAFAGQFWERR